MVPSNPIAIIMPFPSPMQHGTFVMSHTYGDAWCAHACGSFVNIYFAFALWLQRAFLHLVVVASKFVDMVHSHGDDKVIFINKDFARWVQQHLLERVYKESRWRPREVTAPALVTKSWAKTIGNVSFVWGSSQGNWGWLTTLVRLLYVQSLLLG